MNTLTRSELKALMEQHNNTCISIFLPMYHKVSADTQQDPVQFKNQLSEVEHLLLARDISSKQVETLLEPLEALLDDQALWLHPSDGLAVLRSPDTFRYYQLPFSCKEQVIIDDHFYLKPLLPFLTYDTSDERFYILTLSQNEVRLLEATPYAVKEVSLPKSVPSSLAEAMKYDKSKNMVEYHSSASGGTIGKGGRQPLIFHGQGVDTGEEKKNILRYFQQIDRGLHELLHNKTVPLILAGVNFLQPIYHKANTYPYLLSKGVPGNPDKLKLKDKLLHKQAWPIVEPHLRKRQQETLTQLEKYKGTDHVSTDMSDIIHAAYNGRIDSLFITPDQEQWGAFDPTTLTVLVHQRAEVGDEEIQNLAATQTILHDGDVYVVEREKLPDNALLAAVYRY
jgi:hypothetical protein